MVILFLLVEDVNTVMSEGYTHIRVYTDTSETGTFTTLDGTVTLVADTESYRYVDSDGTSDTWYRTCYYSVANGVGDASPVRKGETSSAYATVVEFRNHTDLGSETTDWELAQILDGVSNMINRFCNRPDGFVADPASSVRYYAGSGTPIQRIDECVEIDLVSVKDEVTSDDYTDWNAADWIAFSGDPMDPDFNALPYNTLMVDPTGDESTFTGGKYVTRAGFRPTTRVSRGAPTVQVTARWGYAETVPHDIRMATLMQAARWAERLPTGMADTKASGDLGIVLYQKALDPDIQQILVGGRYKRRALGRR